MIGVNIWYPFM